MPARRRLLPALTAAVLAALGAAPVASPARARDPVALVGAGREVALSAEALRALSAETLTVAYLTSKGPERARFSGPRLWDVLVAQGLLAPEPHGALLRSLVIVTAGDGYTLVLAAGDLAPELGDAPVLLAHAREGEAIAPARAPRLVVPGDRRGARQVFDVARIEVRVVDVPEARPPEDPVSENPAQEKTP